MSKNETIYWYVLDRMHDNSVTLRRKLAGKTSETAPEHAISTAALEAELVLKFGKSDIEETLFFLEKRDYIRPHAYGLAAPRMAFALTEKALQIIRERKC